MLAALIVASTASAQANNVNMYGVTIESCVVNQKDGLTNGINVVYVNTQHLSPVTYVEFVVRYRGNIYVLKDWGTFSRTAEINHNINNALVGQQWTGPTPEACAVHKVILQSGVTEGPPPSQ